MPISATDDGGDWFGWEKVREGIYLAQVCTCICTCMTSLMVEYVECRSSHNNTQMSRLYGDRKKMGFMLDED